MKAVCKTFEELTGRELYEILKLRAQVFIVEQGGRYLDPDGLDPESTHLFLSGENGEILGCLRIYPAAGEPGTVQIGRIVTAHRGRGYGRKLLTLAQQEAVRRYGASRIFITGRKDALGFYLKCGYSACAPGKNLRNILYYEFRKTL